MQFKTKILQLGNNTGIEVTEKILKQLGGGKKPLVIVTLNNYSYRSAVGKIGEKFMISLSSENRKNAKVEGGDVVEITLELDTTPRIVEIPYYLKKVLYSDEITKLNFDNLAPSKKKAIILSIIDAKTEETRTRRIKNLLENLK